MITSLILSVTIVIITYLNFYVLTEVQHSCLMMSNNVPYYQLVWCQRLY